MNYVDFFKLQSKNLLKDFKTKEEVYDEVIDGYLYRFSPKYFDVENIEVTYDFSKEEIEKFSLMKAQHFIAQLIGFKKWNDLIKATPEELELAKLLFDNQDKLSLDCWEYYLRDAERMNNRSFSNEGKLEIFKFMFIDGDLILNPNDFRISNGT